MADYLLALRGGGRAETTIKDRRRLLLRFGRYFDGRLDVTPTEAASFLTGLSVSRNSLSQYQICLRMFFGHCLLCGWIPANPMAVLPSISPHPALIEPVSLQAVQRALAVASRRQADLVLILVTTGLRASELVAVKESDVDWDTGIICVRGKGSWRRTVAIFGPAVAALKRQVGRLSYEIIRREFQGLQKNAGLAGLTAHKLRHTFAVAFVRNGGRVDLLQRLLGHKHLNTTQIYLVYNAQDEALEAQRHFGAMLKLTAPIAGVSHG